MQHVQIEVVTRVTYQITDAEYDIVYTLYNAESPMKVTAVKFIRAQHTLSLKEAKDICDTIGKRDRGENEKVNR